MTRHGAQHRTPTDRTGQRFGMLTAVSLSHSDGKHYHWIFLCDCGTTTTRNARDVAHEANRGHHVHCGCATERLRHQAKSHGMSKHPAYAVWRSMVDRCRLTTHQAWKNYGGRGITVCEAWQTFETFWADMGPTYRPGVDLDRRDNDRGYSAENCRWVTRRVNTMNKRATIRDVDIPMLSLRTGVPRSTLYYRWKNGWTAAMLNAIPSKCSTS